MRTSAHDRRVMREAGLRFARVMAPGETEEVFAEATIEAAPDSRTRRQMRLRRQAASATANAAVAAAGGEQPALSLRVREIANERIIGEDDLQDLNYLELALAVARSVARIRLGGGAASGFLVAPGVLLTNNHVFPSAAAALRSTAQFDYQAPSPDRPTQVHSFGLDPARFFFTDEFLDFSFVAVAPIADTGRSLALYPWVQLIETLGKAEVGEPINII